MIREAAIKVFDQVFTGRRHSDAFHSARHHGLDRLVIIQNAIQGFVTDDGSFLDREQAAQHALACGQVKVLTDPKCLYSEDLY